MSEQLKTIEARPHQLPAFDGGVFTIEYFTSEPQGLEVINRNSLPRRDRHPEGDLQVSGRNIRPLDMSQADKDLLKEGMQSEATKFGYKSDFPRDEIKPETSKLAELRKQQLKGVTADDLHKPYVPTEAELPLLQRRQELIEQAKLRDTLGLKVGIESAQLIGNALYIDTRPVSYPAYGKLSRPGMNSEVEDISSATGVCAVVRTADNKFLLQYRAELKVEEVDGVKKTSGNASYGGIPGASVAGLLDGKLDHERTRTDSKGQTVHDRGKLQPVTTQTIQQRITEEGSQEVGLGEGQVEYRIVGLAHDKTKPHHEFLLLGSTKLTAEDVLKQARQTKKNQKLSEKDFEEKFVPIDATPEAIETLLTKVKCPLPPTHLAAYVAAGYALVLEQGGKEAAEIWKKEMQMKITENYNDINRKVMTHYQKHPELLEKKDDKRPPRNSQGYSADYTPSEQGLPTFDAEVIRTGLVKPEMSEQIEVDTLEKTAKPNKIWMLDIDGVITNATSHEIEQPIIIDTILKSLRNGEPVALNTGRTLNFALQHVVPELLNAGLTDEELANFYAVGEKGATTLWYKDGKFHMWRDKDLVVDESLREDLDKFVTLQVGDTMFPGEPKPSMLSPQLKEKLSPDLVEKFEQEDHMKVYLYAKALIESRGLQGTYRVDKTKIAVDIEHARMGKQLGAQRILDWLSRRNIDPKHFIGVGDSGSDAQMADEVYKEMQKKSRFGRPTVEFIFAGNRESFTKYLVSQDLPTPQYSVAYTAPDSETKPVTDKSFADYLASQH